LIYYNKPKGGSAILCAFTWWKSTNVPIVTNELSRILDIPKKNIKAININKPHARIEKIIWNMLDYTLPEK
jgi:hypothetical protein